ncbi:transmembrane protein, putative [Bodo saltans]|uniref:Transmembrane protein, putative n=1 Tax=Bodo saltans TaxID=75058 RepID=A0A0S4J6D4_BODSA|nr:transmembrane protein, putative [Bodo saltans]|eukprot:CUG85828.1 transmembrane protein, putative [Bodo saltans]
MTLIATNSSMVGRNNIVVVANVSDQMVDCLVSLSLVSLVLLQQDDNSSVPMFHLSNIRLVRTFRTSIANATATSGCAAVIFVAQFLSTENVSVSLIDSAVSGNQSRLILFLQVSLNGSRIDINNATCTTEVAAVRMSNVTVPANDVALTIANSFFQAASGLYLDYLDVTSLELTHSRCCESGYQGQAIYLSQTSMSHSVIALHDVTCVAPQTALVLNNSSVNNSSFMVSQYLSSTAGKASDFSFGLLSASNTALRTFSLILDYTVVVADDAVFLVYADTQSTLDDVTVSVFNSILSSNQSQLILLNEVRLNVISVNISNVTCSTQNVAVQISSLQSMLNVTLLQLTIRNTTLTGFNGLVISLTRVSISHSVIALHDVTCVAPQTALVLNNSSALNSSIVVSNLMSVVTNASSTFYGGLFYCFAASLQQFSISIDHSVVVADDYPMYLAYAGTQSILDDVTMSVNNSTVSGNQSHLIRFAEVTLNNVSINISNVTCSSQLVAIQMDGQQRHVNNVALTITHSYIAAAFAVRLQSFNATSFSLLVAATTLRIVNSSNLTNYLDALYCFNGSFSDSSLVFDSVRTISDAPSLPQAGQMVQFREFTLAKTTVIIFLTTLEGSGGIIAVWSTIVDQSSTLRVQVAANIAVAPSFGRAIVYIYLTTISHNSVVEIILPQSVQMNSGASQFGALYIDSVSVIDSSILRLASLLANSSAALKWPNAVLWLLSTTASGNSTVEVVGLLAQTSTSIGISLASCSIRGNSSLSLWHVEVSSTSTATLGVSFAGTTTSINSNVTLGLLCSLSRCLSSSSGTFSSSSNFLAIFNRSSAITTPITVTISSTTFSDSVATLNIPSAVSGMTVSSMLSISIVGCKFTSSAERLNSPQQFLLISLPADNMLTVPLVISSSSVTSPSWTTEHDAQNHVSFILLDVASLPSIPTVKMSLTTSQLTMYGVDSLIDVPYSLAANVAGLVSTASITCSWWGRHAFTGNLASIHKALRGTVLRGPQSAVSASTIITAVASCGVAYDNNGDWSWTASASPSTTTRQTKSLSSTPSLFTSSHVFAKATKTPTMIDESRSLTILRLRRFRSNTFSEREGTSTTLSSRVPPPISSLAPTASNNNHLSTTTAMKTKSVTLLQPISSAKDALDDAPPSLQAASFAAVAGAFASGSAIADAAAIATLAMMTCAGKRGWDSNTGAQRLVVSVFYDLGPGASIVGNVGLSLVILGLQFLLVKIVACVFKKSPPLDAAVLLQFPNVSWKVFSFLLPGVLFGAVSLFSASEDQLFGPSVAGRSSAAGVTLVTSVALFLGCVMKARRTFADVVFTSSTTTFLKTPFLPAEFLRYTKSWLLPLVTWKPTSVKYQYGDFYSSVASTDATWVHNLFQVHGAVFALIVAIPFPQSVCVAQFVLAIVWMCVPVGLVLWWQLQLLRRPPSNHLLLMSKSITIGVLIATLMYSEGPEALQGGALTARNILSWALTVVSALTTGVNFLGGVAEYIAKRNKSMTMKKGKDRHDTNGNLDLTKAMLVEDADSSSAAPEQLLFALNESDSDVSPLWTRRQATSTDAAILDARIEHILKSPVFEELRRSRDTRYGGEGGGGELSSERWEQLRQLTLSLLVTRATLLIMDNDYEGVKEVDRRKVTPIPSPVGRDRKSDLTSSAVVQHNSLQHNLRERD